MEGMHSMDIAKGSVSNPLYTWTWVSSLFEPCVSNFTLGPSWSAASRLAFLFSVYSTSCGLHYAYVICEGVKRRENWVWSWGKLFGAILFFGTFSDCLWEPSKLWNGESKWDMVWELQYISRRVEELSQPQQCSGGGRESSWHLRGPTLWEGCQLLYFNGYMGENSRNNLKNTNVNMIKMSLKMYILS